MGIAGDLVWAVSANDINPAQHDRVRRIWEEIAEESSRKRLTEYPPAHLSPEQSVQVGETEDAARNYITTKMRRLGMPEDKIPVLPNVQYAYKKGPEDDGRAGFYDETNNIPVVFVGSKFSDFFDRLSSIPYELSVRDTPVSLDPARGARP